MTKARKVKRTAISGFALTIDGEHAPVAMVFKEDGSFLWYGIDVDGLQYEGKGLDELMLTITDRFIVGEIEIYGD